MVVQNHKNSFGLTLKREHYPVESTGVFNIDKKDKGHQPVNPFFHKEDGAITVIVKTLDGSEITQQQGIKVLLVLSTLDATWRPSGWKIHMSLMTIYVKTILTGE